MMRVPAFRAPSRRPAPSPSSLTCRGAISWTLTLIGTSPALDLRCLPARRRRDPRRASCSACSWSAAPAQRGRRSRSAPRGADLQPDRGSPGGCSPPARSPAPTYRTPKTPRCPRYRPRGEVSRGSGSGWPPVLASRATIASRAGGGEPARDGYVYGNGVLGDAGSRPGSVPRDRARRVHVLARPERLATSAPEGRRGDRARGGQGAPRRGEIERSLC